jgi:hypothetical protein
MGRRIRKFKGWRAPRASEDKNNQKGARRLALEKRHGSGTTAIC